MRVLTGCLRQLCGRVVHWKRGTDPLSGAPLKFGFCEYGNMEAAARAMKVLNGLKLGDAPEQLLTLKADDKALAAMELYGKRRRMMLNNEAERHADDQQQAAEDERVRQAARQLLKLRADGQLKPAAAAAAAATNGHFLRSGGRGGDQ